MASFHSLPEETINEIAATLEDDRDIQTLLQLSVTSKQLHRIVEPHLYRKVSVTLPNSLSDSIVGSAYDLLRTLADHPSRGGYVRNLTVQVARGQGVVEAADVEMVLDDDADDVDEETIANEWIDEVEENDSRSEGEIDFDELFDDPDGLFFPHTAQHEAWQRFDAKRDAVLHAIIDLCPAISSIDLSQYFWSQAGLQAFVQLFNSPIAQAPKFCIINLRCDYNERCDKDVDDSELHNFAPLFSHEGVEAIGLRYGRCLDQAFAFKPSFIKHVLIDTIYHGHSDLHPSAQVFCLMQSFKSLETMTLGFERGLPYQFNRNYAQVSRHAAQVTQLETFSRLELRVADADEIHMDCSIVIQLERSDPHTNMATTTNRAAFTWPLHYEDRPVYSLPAVRNAAANEQLRTALLDSISEFRVMDHYNELKVLRSGLGLARRAVKEIHTPLSVHIRLAREIGQEHLDIIGSLRVACASAL